jgi:hypothetical protein
MTMNTQTTSSALPRTDCSSFCYPHEKCCITEDGKCDAFGMSDKNFNKLKLSTREKKTQKTHGWKSPYILKHYEPSTFNRANRSHAEQLP